MGAVEIAYEIDRDKYKEITLPGDPVIRLARPQQLEFRKDRASSWTVSP